MKEKKEALIVLGISIPLLCYGAFSFEFGGAGSTVEAISVAVSTTLGLAGVIGGLVLFFTKTSLGLIETKTDTDLHIGTPIEATLRKEELRNLVKDVPEESWTETIDDEFNKLRANATSVDSKEEEERRIALLETESLSKWKNKDKVEVVEEEEPKPIIKKEKEMSKIKDAITKEKPVKKSGSESISLMKREKVLVERVSELNGFLNETETKLSQVRENLETKGWVNSDNGWVIE